MRESSAASRAAGIVAPSSTSSRCRDASARFQVETTSASTDRTRRARSAAARFSSALETRTMARGPIGIVSPRDRCLSVPSWVGSSMSAPPSSASAGRPSRLVLRTRPAAARPRASAARSSAELDTFARSDDSSGKGAGGGRSPAAPISACGDSPTRKASAALAARLSAAAVNTSARALAASASARTTSTRGTRPASKRSRTAPAVRPSRSTRALARDSSSSSASSLSHAAVTASRVRSTAALVSAAAASRSARATSTAVPRCPPHRRGIESESPSRAVTECVEVVNVGGRGTRATAIALSATVWAERATMTSGEDSAWPSASWSVISIRGVCAAARDVRMRVTARSPGAAPRGRGRQAATSGLRLLRDGFGGPLRGLRVAEIPAVDLPERSVERVDERNTRRDVQLWDLVIRNAVEMLHERAQAVAMSRDEHLLSAREARDDRVVPVREEAVHDDREALGGREDLRRKTRIASIEPRVGGVLRVEGRRRDRVAAPPLEELLVAVLLRRLLLVEALERAVVPLVQAPRALDGNPELVELLEDDLRREDRARQERGVETVEAESLCLEQSSGGVRLLDAFRREADVHPSGEAVLEVPRALAVADEDEFVLQCQRAHTRSINRPLRRGGPARRPARRRTGRPRAG